MRRFVSFTSVPKETLYVSVPEGLSSKFRKYAASIRLKPNELMTYFILEAIGEDPALYGLHPLKDVMLEDTD